MKTILILLATITVSVTSVAQKNSKANSFKITGTVTGFQDNTVLYLSDLSEGADKNIDSTLVLNGKFRFTGTLGSKIVKYVVHTKEFVDSLAVWIDHSETFIFAEKGRFNEAIVKGSKAQIKKQELDAIIIASKDGKSDRIRFIQENPSSIVSAELLSIALRGTKTRFQCCTSNFPNRRKTPFMEKGFLDFYP